MKIAIDSIVLDQISKVRGRDTHLYSLSENICLGQTLAVVGRNGAGKSTLLEIMAANIRPSTGHVHFLDKNKNPILQDRAFRSRSIFLSQKAQLYGSLSGFENLNFFAELYAHAKNDVQILVEIGISYVDRLGFKQSDLFLPTNLYSRGMFQKLQIARALMTKPQVLFLDECFSGLDYASQNNFIEILTEEKDSRITLIVSHETLPLTALCDRWWHFESGKCTKTLDGRLDSLAALEWIQNETISATKGHFNKTTQINTKIKSDNIAKVENLYLPGLIQSIYRLFKKDLHLHFRSKELFVSTAYFGFLVVLMFAFAFFQGDAPTSSVAGGVLWTSLLFSGALFLVRAFEADQGNQAFEAIWASPIPRQAIYLSKLKEIFLLLLLVLCLVTPSVFFFFNLNLPWPRNMYLMGIIFLGTYGYVILGTLLSALLHKSKTNERLLPLMLYPLALPVLILGSKATVLLFDLATPLSNFGLWFRILISFDLIFLVAALWLFEPLLDGDT